MFIIHDISVGSLNMMLHFNIQRGFPEASKVVQVKVHYIGYETTDDAWVSIDMLKCKALSKEKAHPRC